MGVLFIMILAWPLFAIWSGFALSVLWGWFMVPAFGLPELSIPIAIGIAMIAGYLTRKVTYPSEVEATEDERLFAYLFNGFVSPAIALGFGFFVQLFV